MKLELDWKPLLLAPVLALVAEVLGHALSHDRCVAKVARDQSLWAQLSQVLLPLHVSAGSAASDTTQCGTGTTSRLENHRV